MTNRRTTNLILSSILIIILISNFLSVFAYNPNGIKLFNLTGNNNTSTPISCYDGSFYYVFFVNNNNLYYSYAANPNSTANWFTQTIHTGDSNGVVFGVYCGYGTTKTYVIYAQNVFTNTSENARYTSIVANNIGTKNVAFSLSSGGGSDSIDQVSIIPYQTGFFFAVGWQLAVCNSYNVYIYSSASLFPQYTLARTSDCSGIGYSLESVNGIPMVVYSCYDTGSSQLCNNGGAPRDIIGFTKYVSGSWQSITYVTISHDYFISANNNSTVIFMPSTYQVFGSSYQTDYYKFNIANNAWDTPSTDILAWGGANPTLANNIEADSWYNFTIPRIYYNEGQNIYYIYPTNETQTNQHTLYNTGASSDTVYLFNVQNSQLNKTGTYFGYMVSSSNPQQIKWNGIHIPFGQPTASTVTRTKILYTTQFVSPGLSKCVDTNSCATNQSSEFIIVLLPSLIIIAIFEYLTYAFGARDERIFIFVFMLSISILGFLSMEGSFGQNGLPWYIPIFSDIIGFMLLITFKGSNNSGGF